jgi:putative restriction endonuclease
MTGQRCLVANTDERWFQYLQSIADNGRLDEVNFWRPLASYFRALTPGQPLFFRLKAPIGAIVGYGFFAHFTFLPIGQAWITFGERNGDPSLASLVSRLSAYRRETPKETALGARSLGCIVLREVHLFDEPEWLSWSEEEEWHPRIQTYKTYDLALGSGRLLATLLKSSTPTELHASFELVRLDQREHRQSWRPVREGQGVFRVRVLDAYERKCAVTGERSLPVLDAAHIQPYLGPPSNHIQNGISLRTDIHRLFDEGYVTVTPELRFEVSRRLKEDFENGRAYYALSGARVSLPEVSELRPSEAALEWHATQLFKG